MTRITVRVQPNASKNEIVGCVDDVWKIRLTASPTDGEANQALIRFLSKQWKVPQREIEIIKGKTSRTKVIRIPQDAMGRRDA
ncbi:YggU family protein [Candidatus Uhrbacteria bacterium]|nr:YggU family protein [Candidatus Uhrbacteria bacterium]MBD3284594.1 YggU family protein [Candidatus Uhrbacteria bacterium]